MDTIETRGSSRSAGWKVGSGGEAERGLTPGGDQERHPTIDNVNALLTERLSTTEHICRRIAAMTGAPAALVAAIVLQFVWIGISLATNWDPYPFVFLLTCSNVIQLILIFVIAVGRSNSRCMTSCGLKPTMALSADCFYHQEAQELLLVRLAEKLDVDARDLRPILSTLAGKAARSPA